MTKKYGQTFRLLLKAIIGMSEGNKIIYITNTEYEGYELWSRAITILKDCGINHLIPRRGTVRIKESLGEITFLSNQAYQNKLSYGDFNGQHGITAIRDVR